MNDSTVLVEFKGDVAWLTLNRPASMNAMSVELVAGIEQALDRVDEHHGVRAVVFIGNGKAFSAGGDLKAFKEALGSGNHERFLASLRAGQKMFRRVEQLSLPTIAAVNGVAVAGGLELILSCDLAVAAESARIGDGHAKFGIIPGGGSSVRLPRKLPVALAKQLLYTGELMPAARLAEWGLINKVVPDAQLVEEVEALTYSIAANSPLGLRWIKRLVDDGLQQPSDSAWRLEMAAFESYARSEDILEGLSAFEEKRKPSFRGR
ncbi:enoyl-CoA hydratase/isomerase family protein [Stutzerimonas stutzeri]|uniref:enoyl-CoA hydratase/isomerase family protein n=1 Tax=Stutzerimonas stutzeri TaxID=316 RepID=UPI00210B8B04|nr:enoyl-CoA hydratase/isomerase family protein [Stutzerimonas stutzeri]MCQ4323024.1 enoyl-CoA hydratase/isomerase family protein [Stutzerimonas stutzeri]